MDDSFFGILSNPNEILIALIIKTVASTRSFNYHRGAAGVLHDSRKRHWITNAVRLAVCETPSFSSSYSEPSYYLDSSKGQKGPIACACDLMILDQDTAMVGWAICLSRKKVFRI